MSRRQPSWGLGLEVVSVHEIQRNGFDLVTRNRADFITLTVDFFHVGSAHAGVLIVPHSLPNHQPARLAHALHR